MSLPEVKVSPVTKCEDCDNFIPEMHYDIGRPCIHQLRISVDRFCVDFKPKEKTA